MSKQAKHVHRGKFITLEGIDGAGKSTQFPWLLNAIEEYFKVDVISTREPGGTPLGESLRSLLLTQSMSVKTEALLMFAARNEHLETTIEPALEAGQWVVCDRFTDASYAYQGGGKGLSQHAIAALEQLVHPTLQPDYTLLFDVSLNEANARRSHARSPDRFEQESLTFFQRVREAYLERAQKEPHRFHIIDTSGTIEAVRTQLEDVLQRIKHDAFPSL